MEKFNESDERNEIGCQSDASETNTEPSEEAKKIDSKELDQSTEREEKEKQTEPTDEEQQDGMNGDLDDNVSEGPEPISENKDSEQQVEPTDEEQQDEKDCDLDNEVLTESENNDDEKQTEPTDEEQQDGMNGDLDDEVLEDQQSDTENDLLDDRQKETRVNELDDSGKEVTNTPKETDRSTAKMEDDSELLIDPTYDETADAVEDPNNNGDSAYDRLHDYYSSHNYEKGDFSKYSKDPEWRELNNEYLQELGKEPIDYSEKDGNDTTNAEALRKEWIARGIPEDSPELAAMVENEQRDFAGDSNNAAEGNSDVYDTESSLEEPDEERFDSIRERVEPHMDAGREVAKNHRESGRFFTDHGTDHREEVKDQSLEAVDALRASIRRGRFKGENTEKHIAFSPDVDKNTLGGAALWHDSGMDGEGYALTEKPDGTCEARPCDPNNYDEVRRNHSLNSALNVLANRDDCRSLGYTDAEIDKMAAECMAHSKSSSGVGDLNSKELWSGCFDRINAATEAYNKDHPESPIYFNRDTFEKDDNQWGSLATESYALRIGDVSRSSKPGAITQSGEPVYIDRDTINDGGGSIEKELDGAKITIGDNGEEIPESNMVARRVHAGEQNIVDNNQYVDDAGFFVHEITVEDGASAPKCTHRALEDHIGELASAGDAESVMEVKFNEPWNDDVRKSYDNFRNEMQSIPQYKNRVEIIYPWDKE